jgi:hypothetical protein
MTEQAAPRFSKKLVRQIKDAGFMDRDSKSTEAVMRCAGCPLASEKPFYASRAIKCASLQAGTVISIVHRLADRNFLEGRSDEEIDTKKASRRPRVLYRLNAKARSILKGSKPLPNCEYRKREQVVTQRARRAGLVPTDNVSLAELRRGTGATQGDVARRLITSLRVVSGLENREVDSMTVGRLRGYVEALGGDLRLIVNLKGKPVELKRNRRSKD